MTTTVNTNVIEFVQFIGCGTFGENLFFGRVPQSNKTSTALWWIAPVNANNDQRNVTGESVISYRYQLFYRDVSMKKVDEHIFEAVKGIVSHPCYNLNDFQTMAVDFNSSSQGNLIDEEDRVIGSVMFTVKVYDIANDEPQSI